jgi:predicted transcriptional regulator
MLKRGRPYQRIQAVMIGRDTHTREEIIAFTTRDVLLVPRRKWAKRPRDSRTISVRLPKADEMRLLRLAERSGITSHAIMKQAICRHLDRAEADEWLASWGEGGAEAVQGARALIAYTTVVPGTGLTERMAAMIARGINRLRAVRAGRGFELGRLAARLEDLGVPADETALAAIEEGKATPNPKLLAALAKALGVSPDDLVG